jgi:CubicO group peptidase (beta-lactamase class C family)
MVNKENITSLISEGISHKIFPGCVVGYNGYGGCGIIQEGKITYDSDALRVEGDTIYDIASLTKIITTTGILVLNTNKQLDLDDPINNHLNVTTFPGVTIRHILAHVGGLTLSLSSLKDLPKNEIDMMILNTPPTSEPGEKTYYSNQGFYILGKIIEYITNQPLVSFFEENIFRPLGMIDTQANPLARLKSRIAPTEDDKWRGKLIWGEPHDETAYKIGALCGHAGLFSTAQDLLRLGGLWLDMGKHKNTQIVSPELISEGTHDNFPKAKNSTGDYNYNFALGWRLHDRKFIGSLASDNTYAFSGFTGPSLMVDPQKGAVVAIMNNRVHPSRLTSNNRALYHANITNEVYNGLNL